MGRLWVEGRNWFITWSSEKRGDNGGVKMYHSQNVISWIPSLPSAHYIMYNLAVSSYITTNPLPYQSRIRPRKYTDLESTVGRLVEAGNEELRDLHREMGCDQSLYAANNLSGHPVCLTEWFVHIPFSCQNGHSSKNACATEINWTSFKNMRAFSQYSRYSPTKLKNRAKKFYQNIFQFFYFSTPIGDHTVCRVQKLQDFYFLKEKRFFKREYKNPTIFIVLKKSAPCMCLCICGYNVIDSVDATIMKLWGECMYVLNNWFCCSIDQWPTPRKQNLCDYAN